MQPAVILLVSGVIMFSVIEGLSLPGTLLYAQWNQRVRP